MQVLPIPSATLSFDTIIVLAYGFTDSEFELELELELSLNLSMFSLTYSDISPSMFLGSTTIESEPELSVEVELSDDDELLGLEFR